MPSSYVVSTLDTTYHNKKKTRKPFLDFFPKLADTQPVKATYRTLAFKMTLEYKPTRRRR